MAQKQVWMAAKKRRLDSNVTTMKVMPLAEKPTMNLASFLKDHITSHHTREKCSVNCDK
jgi:hypothetical protein